MSTITTKGYTGLYNGQTLYIYPDYEHLIKGFRPFEMPFDNFVLATIFMDIISSKTGELRCQQKLKS